MQNSFESKQYGFALHTSSPQLGVALSNFSGDSRSQIWDLGRDMSTHLQQYIVDFLKPQTWKDLAFIAVAKGPGSFTGTRMGVVTARTLAQQLDIPLFAVSTLAAVAWSHFSQIPPSPTSMTEGGVKGSVIAVQMPAQRGQLFTAIYQLPPSSSILMPLFPDSVLSPEKWQQTLSSWSTPYQLVEIPAGVGLGNSVSSVLELAYGDWQQGKHPHWSEALPFYGQHPVEV